MTRVFLGVVILSLGGMLLFPAGTLWAQQTAPPVRPTVVAELKGVQVPADGSWCMAEVALGARATVVERGIEFIFVLRGQVEVTVASETTRLGPGQGIAIAAGVRRAVRGGGHLVSFVLGGRVPAWDGAEVLRSGCSEPLRGLRAGPQLARLVRVAMSPGAQTPVHTHPGPELVYAPQTPIIFQTEGRLRWVMGRDLAVVPGDSPLQARNISAQEAWFLALFIVADGAPFQTNLPGFQQPPGAQP